MLNTSTSDPSSLQDSARLIAADDATFHVTHRLLIETAGDGQHLVFNPLSGAVDIIDDTELAQIRRLQSGDSLHVSEEERRQLYARAYAFASPAEEEAFLDKTVDAAWGRMLTGQAEMYTVCPTLACNLACSYCFEGDSLLDKAQGVMSDAQVDALFVAISGLRGHQGGKCAASPWLSLFGGEPLLPSTRRCVSRLLKRASETGFLVAATTNGVNLTRYEDLLREYADILTGFQVTLDGPKVVHDRRRHRLGGQGTFDEIVRGIDLLLEIGVDVDLRVNVDSGNIDSLPQLVDVLFERGWADNPHLQFALAPVTDHGGGCTARSDRALTEMEMTQRVLALMETHPRMAQVCHLGFLRHLDYLVSVLEPEKHRGRHGTKPGPRYWYCEASTDRQYVFTPEGLIYSCTEAVGKPKHAIGRFDPYLDLWREPVDQWQGRTILSHPKCRTCSISTLCGGGCNFSAREQSASRLLQITVAGRPTAPFASNKNTEPFCNAADKTVRSYLRHAGLRKYAA